MHRMSGIPSGSAIISDEALDRTYHFKWRSIRNLLYLTFTFSGYPPFFHIFNDLIEESVTVFSFTVFALCIGMTYMCADLFIKQYTRRLDWDQNLSPVLNGITFCLILQSTLFCLLSLRYAGDGARYLVSSFMDTPVWSVCSAPNNISGCMTSREVLQYCEKPGPRKLISLNSTSAHIYYTSYMYSVIGGAWTWRFFVSAVVWVLNFCLTTTPDSVVLKYYKYTLQLKHACSIITFVYLAVSTGRAKEAFLRLMNTNTNCSISESLIIVAMVYGVGRIGVHDFGNISPFTMIDNAVIIFTIVFILLSMIRSMIVYILVMELRHCVDMSSEEALSWHYTFYVLLPLATEFLYAQKLINIFLQLHVIMSLLPLLMLFTLTTSRLFQSEFSSVKFIYIQGLTCLFGFCCSIPVLLLDQYHSNVRYGLINGFSMSILYLGALRMAIIMWIYGVKKFSTDIHFWLGFSPTKFWTICWSILPAVLLAGFGYGVFESSNKKNSTTKTSCWTWFLASAVIVFAFQTRTIVRYVMQNNIMGAFRSNKKYGPFDPRDRKRRRRYDATIDQRQCFHDCMSIDEEIECNHLPLMNTGEGPSNIDSDTTLLQMYEDVSRSDSVITIVETHEKKPDTKEKQA